MFIKELNGMPPPLCQHYALLFHVPEAHMNYSSLTLLSLLMRFHAHLVVTFININIPTPTLPCYAKHAAL